MRKDRMEALGRQLVVACGALALVLAAPAASGQTGRTGQPVPIDPASPGIGAPGERPGQPDQGQRNPSDEAGQPEQLGQPGPAGAAQEVPAECGRSYKQFDRNRDGKVSQKEFVRIPSASGEPKALFGARDADGDGDLTKAEFCSGWAAGPGSMGRYGAGMPAHGGMGRAAGALDADSDCQVHFKAFDSNANGRVTTTEIASRWPRLAAEVKDSPGATGLSEASITQTEFCESWLDAGQDTTGTMGREPLKTHKPGSEDLKDRSRPGIEQPSGSPDEGRRPLDR